MALCACSTSRLVSTRKLGISARSDGDGRLCVLAFCSAASCAIPARNVDSTCFIELRSSRRSNGVREGLLARNRQASLSQFFNAYTSCSSASATNLAPRYSADRLCDSWAHKRNDDSVVRPTLASQGVDKPPRARRGRSARLRYLRLVEYARSITVPKSAAQVSSKSVCISFL